jgi:hypothetical protein
MPTMEFELSDPLAAATIQAAHDLGCPVAERKVSMSTPFGHAVREFNVTVLDAMQAYRLARRTAVILVADGHSRALIEDRTP